MAGLVPTTITATAANVSSLLGKLDNSDADFRFMGLNDLHHILTVGHPGVLSQEYNLANDVVDGVLKTLDDQNGEVQNLAVKCLGPLVGRIPSSVLAQLIDRLSKLELRNSVDDSIRPTALRAVVANLPHPVPGVASTKAIEDAYSAISRHLIPQLVGYAVLGRGPKSHTSPSRGLLARDPGTGVGADAVDLVIEVGRSFGPLLKDEEILALQTAIRDVLADDRSSSGSKKRAVVALAALAPYFSDDLLSSFVSNLIESFRDPHLPPATRRLLVTIAGAMARSIPKKFGRYLQTLTPFILSPLSQAELADQMERMAEDGERDGQIDEVREAALTTLESFLTSCKDDMRFYTRETIDAALLFLKHDPNVAEEDEDDEGGMAEEQEEDLDVESDEDEDDGFDETDAFNDYDDISWKVRRCAAKVLHALISTRATGDLLENGTLYDKVAPALIRRFKESEENVRLEILAATTLLIRKTGDSAIALKLSHQGADPAASMSYLQSRKRRRGGSDVSMLDVPEPLPPVTHSTALSGPQKSLATVAPSIIRNTIVLMKLKSQPTKQASVDLLMVLASVRPGCLSDGLDNVMPRVLEILKSSSSDAGGAVPPTLSAGGAASTGSSLRIETLRLVAVIVQTHEPNVMRPYLDHLVPCVTTAVKDRFYKVSSEALKVGEKFVDLITPSGPQDSDPPRRDLLHRIYEVIMDRVNSMNIDSEVKQQAVHALGILLARTSGPRSADLLPKPKREAALQVLYDRLKNETTRRAALRAIDEVVAQASGPEDLPGLWTRAVLVELAAQLRKANRSIRIAGLTNIKDLVFNASGQKHLDGETTRTLKDALAPLLSSGDLNLLGLALEVLTKLVEMKKDDVVDDEMVEAICALTVEDLVGTVLEALLRLVRTIGEQGAGAPLMDRLLKAVGVNGDAAVVGRMIGTLLVCGGPNVGVKLEDFVHELQHAQDDKRKCLALSVMGEAALRLGTASPLKPSSFISHFKSKSDQVPLAAAIALGRAGAGDVPKYLPVILDQLDQLDRAGSSSYLLLHSIKEIVTHGGDVQADITPYSKPIWDKVLLTSQDENNRAVGAECVGRLIVIDPKSHLSSLQTYLRDRNASVRGVMIQAFRYALTDADETYDHLLQPMMGGMLKTMLEDADLENARLSMTTLMAANQHKPHLVAPHLGQLLMPVMDASTLKPELVREVQMGPFKHRVDDGIELRKTAYETLFAIMETAFSQMSAVELFDRVIAGLGDEHDIYMLCSLILSKLMLLERDETLRRLDEIAVPLQAALSFKPKENAVKQEFEKADEATRAALKVTVQLMRAFPAASGVGVGGARSMIAPDEHQGWRKYCDWVRKELVVQMRAVQEEAVMKTDD